MLKLARSTLIAVAVLPGLLQDARPAAAQSNFVLQCRVDERIARIVLRTDPFDHIHFLGVECRKGGATRILKVGHETGERHEIAVPSPLVRIVSRHGTCVNDNLAAMARICAVRFEFEDGTASPMIGSGVAAGSETVIDLNGEIYGLAGFYRHREAAAASGFQGFVAVSRKLEAFADPEYRIDGVLDDVRDRMHGAMGYAMVIRNPRGERVGFVRDGWAIHPLDPVHSRHARQYDIRTMAAIGSTTKVLTAVSVLRVDMETPGPSVLDMTLEDALPERWSNLLHTRFQDATVRHVIKHRAGFRHEGPDTSQTGGEFPAWYRLRHGERWPQSIDVGTCQGGGAGRPAGNTNPSLLPAGSGPPYAHCYSNSAGGMFHFILARLARDSGYQTLERELEDVPMSEYNARLPAYTARFYQEFVRSRIFEPAGATGSCMMSDLLGKRPVALGYGGPDDFGGIVQSDSSHGCASGGWIISMDDLSLVLHTIANTDHILNAASRAALFSTDDDIRVWNNRIDRASVHNGMRSDVNAAIVIMPDGYAAALAWSSGAPRLAGNITGAGAIVTAFENNRR